MRNVTFHPVITFARDICFGDLSSRATFCNAVQFSKPIAFCSALAESPDAKNLLNNREKQIDAMLAATARILNYAKHETLRNLDRFFRNRARAHTLDRIFAVNAGAPDNPDSVRIAFSLDEFRQDLLAALEAEQLSVLDTAGQTVFDQVGFSDPWELPAQDTLNFISRRQNLLRDVPDEIWQTIKSELSEGLNKGEPIAELAKRIEKAFGAIEKGRATIIAQTETAAAYSFSSDKATRAAGIKYKKWIHSPISLVPRPDHIAIDGLIVPIDDAFPVGNPPLMFPHDPNGAPGDVINCACLSVPVADEDFQMQQQQLKAAA
jgi:uncharacterized protein with gpF-like domain